MIYVFFMNFFFFVNNFKEIVSPIRSNSGKTGSNKINSAERKFYTLISFLFEVEVEFEKVSYPNKRIQGSKFYLNIDGTDSKKKNPIFVIKNLLHALNRSSQFFHE